MAAVPSDYVCVSPPFTALVQCHPSLLPDALHLPLTALRGAIEAPQKKKVQIQALELFPNELIDGDGS